MEEERDQKELKHVCRLCDKRYPSGKSLGGHMRSHVIANNNSYLSAHKTKFNPSSKKISILDQDAGETTVFKKDSPTAGVVENFGDGSCSGGSNGGGDGPNGGGQHSGYGLRENPKKTWRMVDSNITVKQERVCKQCGKSFQSLKALCGHMSSHSDKERNFHNRSWKDHVEDDDDDDDDDESNDDDDDDGESWAYGDDDEEEEDEEEEDKLVEELAAMDDSQSDNNVVEPESIIRQQNQHHLVKVRSKLKPKTVSYDHHDYFKHKNASVDSFSLANNGNSSSNNSEIEQDQEEIAMCLMMLSRDKSNYHKHHHQKGTGKETRSGGGINLTAESSDNNSVILEGGSSSTHIGSAKRKDLDSISNACGINKNNTNNMKLKQHQNQQQQRGGSSKLKPEMNVEIDNSDSGYFENGAKELESDGSVDGFTRNHKKPKLEFTTAGSGSSNKGKSAALINYYFSEEYNYRDASGSNGSEIKHDSRNRIRNGSQVEARTTAHFPAPQRGINGRYECTVCNKSFKTHQALGGHIITHRKPRHPDTATGNGGSSSIVPKSSASKSEKKSATTTTTKKTKSHKCPFCPKIFRSGQALGGHKRSHLIGAGAAALLEKAAAASSSPRVPSSPKVEVEEEEEEEEEEEKPPLLDLNLPAPMEDEGGNGNGERIAAW